MKEAAYYKCEFCGTLYADKKECDECEKQHVAPKCITGVEFRPRKVCAKYPPRITVEFHDGTIQRYERRS